LDTKEWQQVMQHILKQDSQKYILYGSIYLIGYVMRLSRYNIFAKK
jgi:folylpolyglutamate synthase/dihydropteroate synthase